MRILVTGATGHIGANLLPQLTQAGHEVTALCHTDRRALQGLPVHAVQGDILEPASLTAAFEGQELVYHLAAAISTHGDPGGMVRKVNVDGTRNVLAAARAAGVRRVVHFSSIHAIASHDGVIVESLPLASDPKLPAYDRSKADGERAVAEAVAAGLDVVTVNPVGVVGPVDYAPSPMGDVILRLATGRMPGLVHGGFNWVDARDVAAGAIAAAERGRTGERYLLSSEYVTMVGIAQMVADAGGAKPPWMVSPRWLASLAAPFATAWGSLTGARPLFSAESVMYLGFHQKVSWEKARTELGFSPRPVRESVADALAWFRENGALK